MYPPTPITGLHEATGPDVLPARPGHAIGYGELTRVRDEALIPWRAFRQPDPATMIIS